MAVIFYFIILCSHMAIKIAVFAIFCKIYIFVVLFSQYQNEKENGVENGVENGIGA